MTLNRAESSQAMQSLGQFATPLISDNLERLCGVVGLRPFHGTGILCGPAFTVKTRPGDNMAIHMALDMAVAGEVIVVDGGAEANNALVGEIMKLYAQSRGLGGFVIDGAVRDSQAFAEDGFPCFARGVSHRGPYKTGPGQVGVPVAIGGQVVRPGDWMIGDADGLVVVRPEEAEALLARVAASAAAEEQIKRDIAQGSWDRDWVHALIAKSRPAG